MLLVYLEKRSLSFILKSHSDCLEKTLFPKWLSLSSHTVNHGFCIAKSVKCLQYFLLTRYLLALNASKEVSLIMSTSWWF